MQGREIAARVRAPRPAGLPPSWTPLHTHTQTPPPCRTRMPVRQWSVCLPQSRRYPSTSDLPVESPSPTRRSLCDSGPTVGPHARSAIEFGYGPHACARHEARGAGGGGGVDQPPRRHGEGTQRNAPSVRVAVRPSRLKTRPPAGGSELRRGSPRPARQLAQLEGQSVCWTCSEVAVPHHPVFGKVGLDFGKVGLA